MKVNVSGYKSMMGLHSGILVHSKIAFSLGCFQTDDADGSRIYIRKTTTDVGNIYVKAAALLAPLQKNPVSLNTCFDCKVRLYHNSYN